jgi:hypothetical protein
MTLSAAFGRERVRSSAYESTLTRRLEKEKGEKIEVAKLHECDQHGGYRIT